MRYFLVAANFNGNGKTGTVSVYFKFNGFPSKIWLHGQFEKLFGDYVFAVTNIFEFKSEEDYNAYIAK
jgi:hypothetical protein